MDLVRSDDLSLKYQRCTSSGCKDIDIRKFEFVAKTQFLYELHAVADLKILYSVIELNSRVSSLGSSHLCRCMYIKKKNTIIKLTINIMFLDKDMEISRKLPHPFVKSGFRYCRARNLKEYR